MDRRKRALFSCDRCKIRKIKCRRVSNNDLKYDNITPCIQCSKAGVACTTSIPRKKRFYGPVKNVSLHYRCLLALVIGLFPDKDVYNIEELIDLGHSLKIEMPSTDSSSDNQPFRPGIQEVQNASSLKAEPSYPLNEDAIKPLTEDECKDGYLSGNSRHAAAQASTSSTSASSSSTDLNKLQVAKDKKVLLASEAAVKQEPPSLPPSIKVKKSAQCDSDRLIMDRFGHTHYIGNFGTASVLNGLCDIIIKRSSSSRHTPTSTQDIRDSTLQTITSENEPVYQYPTHLYNLDTINVDRFPLINLIGRQEADIYVSVFFEKVHPYYFIFNRKRFDQRYELFWKEIKKTSKAKGSMNEPLRLSGTAICCIYMVWILGRRFMQYSSKSEMPKGAVLDLEMTDRFIDIIRLTLSDVVLTPTIDGIRLLFLFSTYLSSIKVRESGYCLMEMAAIQAKGLGLHRKVIVDKFNDGKSDEMKRIMWSLAKNESILCCSLGRASAIPWEEIDVELPKIDDEPDELFKTYYFKSVRLTRIIFFILDYKKKTQKEPLSLGSLEKALTCQRELQSFWDSLPEQWKDYKSLPIRRYKPKLHIQYHYYYITLTLPMFLHIVSVPNYNIKRGDPLLGLLVHGILSSFETAELVTYTDANGFFNGTIYYDVFYCYNAIMVLTLSYILFVSSKHSGGRTSVVDLDYLDSKYGINLEHLLKEINMIRKLILNNLHKIDGTMRRMSDIIETLLDDLGIIQILVKKYNAPKSNAKSIDGKSESSQTSVSASLPGSFRKLKFHLNHEKHRKRRSQSARPSTKKAKKQTPPSSAASFSKSGTAPVSNQLSAGGTKPIRRALKSNLHSDGEHDKLIFNNSEVPSSNYQGYVQSLPPDSAQTHNFLGSGMSSGTGNSNFADDQTSSFRSSPQSMWYGNDNSQITVPSMLSSSRIMPSGMVNTIHNGNREGSASSQQDSSAASRSPPITSTSNPSNGDSPVADSNATTPGGSNINDVLTSMALNTDLMDALFGTDMLTSDNNNRNNGQNHNSSPFMVNKWS